VIPFQKFYKHFSYPILPVQQHLVQSTNSEGHHNFVSSTHVIRVRARNLLTLILPTWRIWRARNNASKWQMGFNSAFKDPQSLIFYYYNSSQQEHTLLLALQHYYITFIQLLVLPVGGLVRTETCTSRSWW
jgi:hypothetical protein